MTSTNLNHTSASVAIVGAGLSGLCLAQYLRRNGIDAQVYERDAAPFARRQGYRITVDADGLGALRASLPADLYDLAVAVAGRSGGYFRFMNQRLREAFKLSFEETEDGERQMDRQVLRSVLLSGLEDRVHYGRKATAIETENDANRLRFEDGTSVTARVVIAADGIGSALRDQILPGGGPEDTGMAGIYGRTPLVQDDERVLPAELDRSGVLALGDAPGRAVFFTTMAFGQHPKTAFAGRDMPALDIDDYVMWGVVMPQADIPAGTAWNDAPALQRLARDAAAKYHPVVRRLIANADPEATMLSRFAVGRRPGPWAVPNAAVMGDAVHAMPPFGAHGGNTALRDAALLGAKLVAAFAAGGSTGAVGDALAAYREEMIPYAFKAVDTAEGMMRRLTGSKGVQKWVMLRLLPSLHRPVVPAA
ncbi:MULTISPECIES: NAD(P)/FAD-dependent oxidoreductase [Glycomyces]|uniref:2-polyprenyl-6-methoxyphenol hydroxylase-like FAD-dependent oxidoreductase n=2 Tax=Glycomyces TaxID=58113 RepID=A0A9X3PFM9_9ACTN|nr:NAD(P)/FAD-dependent oxidoreductase [Glycomyces lechevalierae]MDA1384591.1 NAD(P)/FAD-dependent oxidoreductase [Glycomyces lechevalierae]MDR7338230.1 2-polyprenyl-6-methoxyphenol hydroxylase-like FAD-dependent oxidoreductase [Glycomyces lechevalierae]